MKALSLDYIITPKTNGANPFKIFEQLSSMDSNTIKWAGIHLCNWHGEWPPEKMIVNNYQQLS